MRPSGPEPCNSVRSTPASRARLRIDGDVNTRAALDCVEAGGFGATERICWGTAARLDGAALRVRSREAATFGAGAAFGLAAAGFASDAFFRSMLAGAAFAAAGFGAATSGAPGVFASVSNTINTAPTGTKSPGSPVVDTTVPVTGDGTSIAALSVITSTIVSSSFTRSPGFTFHSTISASTVPSPKSGNLNSYRLTPT